MTKTKKEEAAYRDACDFYINEWNGVDGGYERLQVHAGGLVTYTTWFVENGQFADSQTTLFNSFKDAFYGLGVDFIETKDADGLYCNFGEGNIKAIAEFDPEIAEIVGGDE